MADLDLDALSARGLSASDVSTALQRQNVILPAGDVKIGDKDYTLAMNNSPDVIEAINAFPIKDIGGRMIFMRDVAHVHDGFQVQTNSVSVNGTPGALMTIRKTGGVSTLSVIDGVRAALHDIDLRQSRASQRALERRYGGGIDRLGHYSFPRQRPAIGHHPCRHPAFNHNGGVVHQIDRADAQHHDVGGLCLGNRHFGR
jgi:hypothetical protein